jgi:hypothetical protein
MEKLIKLQNELNVPKTELNKFGGYKYRTVEQILEAVKPLLDKHGLCLNLTDSVRELCGIPYTEANASIFTIDPKTKERVLIASSYGYAGIDVNQKGMSLGQCFGASSSYARKYALNGLLLIDDNKDPDVTNNHSKATPRKTTTVEQKAGDKKKVIAGTAEYNKLLEWIQTPKGSIEKALEMYDIDKATENIIRKSINK